MLSIATQVHTDSQPLRRRPWNVSWKWTAVGIVPLVLVAVAVRWQTAAAPNSIPAEFFEAWELLDTGRFLEAEKLIEVLMRQKQHGDAYLVLDAALCVSYKDFGAAESRIQAATSKGALRPYVLEVLGKSFFGRQRWYDAERAFATMAHEDPQSHVAHYWLGVVYNDLNMFGQAVREARLASEIQPRDVRSHILLGTVFFRLGRYHAAVEQYQEALRLMSLEATPNGAPTPPLITSLVKCLVADGQFEDGLEQIAAVSEPSVELQILRAECFLGLGQLAEAERECRMVLERNENQQAAIITLAKVSLQKTVAVTAEHAQLLETILDANPNHSEATYLLSQVHGQLGNQQRQQELLNQSKRLVKLQVRIVELLNTIWSQPEDVDSRLEIAKVFDELGDSVQAKQWRQAAAGCQQRINALQGNAP